MTGEPNAPREPSEEELRAALEEQMKRITVKDVLLQTVITLVNLSARKLGLAGDEKEKDLEQAHQAIEGIRALLPLLPTDEQQAVREPLSQLQMRYAQEMRNQESGHQESGAEPQSPVTSHQSPEEAERAKARVEIWTPPGT